MNYMVAGAQFALGLRETNPALSHQPVEGLAMNVPSNAEALVQRRLHGEAGILSQLLRQYVDDRRHVASGECEFIYFIDAHDLKAYLHIEKVEYLDGFMLQAEKLLADEKSSKEIEKEIAFKSEQTLHWLLFNQSRPVILLPSHGEELEQELAYLETRELTRSIGYVDRALKQIQHIKSRAIAGSYLDELALKAMDGRDPAARDDLIGILRQYAPAVAMLLGFTPDTTEQRIKALINDSRVVALSDVDWSVYGFPASIQSAIERLEPDFEAADEWMAILGRVRTNTLTANRLDAEALGYLCALNKLLDRDKQGAHAVLVTRAMSLLHAVRHHMAKEAPSHRLAVESVRHTRLLAAAGTPSNKADIEHKSNANDPEVVLRNLTVALGTYERQLASSRLSGDAEAARLEAISSAQSLVNAWGEFEGGRFTLELRDVAKSGEKGPIDLNTRPRQSSSPQDGKAAEAKMFGTLVDWLRADGELEGLILDRLAQKLRTFELHTFKKGVDFRERMLVRATATKDPKQVRVYPMTTTYVGPIFITPLALDHPVTEAATPDFGELALVKVSPGYGSINAADAYLIWALFHATQGAWALALIYAESAIAASKILRMPSITREARLITAQAHRLVGPHTDDMSRATPRHDRLSSASKALQDNGQGELDPRFQIESCALQIEYGLVANAPEPLLDALQRLALPLLHEAVEPDVRMQIRVGELRVAAACAIHFLGTDATLAGRLTSEVAQAWHADLITALARIRLSPEYAIGDIPRQARAVEILGYQLVVDLKAMEEPTQQSVHTRIPSSLMVDVHDVQATLAKGSDLTSRFVATRLTAAIEATDLARDHNLVYAPVWTKEHVEKTLRTIGDPKACDAAIRANEIVHDLGDAQLILRGDGSEPVRLNEARDLFDVALKITGDVTNPINFFIRMEICYANLLAARIIRDKEQQRAILLPLVEEYRAIGEQYKHHPSAVLHYRLSVALLELDRHDEAFAEIAEAMRLQNSDESTDEGHWIRSTIRRRMGLHFASQANDLLIALEESPDDKELRDGFLHNMRLAFTTVFEKFEEESKKGSYRAMLEERRRLNNIVFYAAMFARGGGNLSDLHLGFSARMLDEFVGRLRVPNAARVPESSILHTIGLALEVLNKPEEAAVVANLLWDALSNSGSDPNSREVKQMNADLLRWKQARSVTEL